MALVKLGGGVTAISGSMAGNTFARNRFGNYVRARTKPVNPRSPGQITIRTLLSYLAEIWHTTLDDVKRGQWETYANAINMNNRLGEAIKLTGFNHFIRSNVARMQPGLLMIQDGPEVLALPTKDPLFSVACTAAGQITSITFDDTLPWCSLADCGLIVFNGIPQNATRNFFNGPWKLAGGVWGDVGSPPESPITITGSVSLVTGQKIWHYARLTLPDGGLSEPMRCESIVA